MAPRVISNELLQVATARHLVSGAFLFRDQLGPHPRCHPAHELDAVHDGAQVVTGCIRAFFEVAKFNAGSGSRITRGNRYAPAAVVRVAFQDYPRQTVVTLAYAL